MLRVLIVIAWIAVTVYAIADWFRTPEEEVPARIPKAMWLILILITIPTFSLGSVAWVILRAVSRAEAGQSPLPPIPVPRPPHSHEEEPRPLAPDDDPDFLFKIGRDIQREKRRNAKTNAAKKAEEETPTTEQKSVQQPDEDENTGIEGDQHSE